jgi:hypothetical protein
VNASCAAFERWLDEGQPAAPSAASRAHARECARCAALLELEEALAQPARAATDARFADAVMARVHALPAAEPAGRRAVATGWAQMLVDPLAALLVTACALLAVGHQSLWRLGESFAHFGEALLLPAVQLPAAPDLSAIGRTTSALVSNPTAFAACMLAITPVLLVAGWPLFRWTEQLVGGSMKRAAVRGAVANAVAR